MRLEQEFQDPFRLLRPLPASLASLFLETENPPRLSWTLKAYYYLRPFIPRFIRRFLQSKRSVKVNDRWFCSSRLIDEYVRNVGAENFTTLRASIWPSSYRSAVVLTHDVETEAGFKYIPKVLDLEKKLGFTSSWNVVPHLYPVHEEILDLIKASNCEIGIHGFNHDGKLYFSKRIFDIRKSYINEALRKYGSVGFRSPAAHRNLDWLQELEIEYDASCFDIDPFQPMPGGTHSIWPFNVGKFVELPYTLPQDHVLWIQLKQKDNLIWQTKANWLYENHGMMLLITHPDYLMLNDNLKRYEDFLIYLNSFTKLWYVLPREITRYWAKRFPVYRRNLSN